MIGVNEEVLDSLSWEELVISLENLWGKKLGKDIGKEVYIVNWIYVVLLDFKGCL